MQSVARLLGRSVGWLVVLGNGAGGGGGGGDGGDGGDGGCALVIIIVVRDHQ